MFFVYYDWVWGPHWNIVTASYTTKLIDVKSIFLKYFKTSFSCSPITKLTRPCKLLFFGVPYMATCIFLIFYNEPELGEEIDPGMAFTPLPSCIGWGLNPRPSNREPGALPQDHSFCSLLNICRELLVIPCNHSRVIDIFQRDNRNRKFSSHLEQFLYSSIEMKAISSWSHIWRWCYN